MMATMKAALYDGKAMQVSEVSRPQVAPDGVLVRVRAAGICGTDLNHFRDVDQPQERPSGHEVAGEIAEVGPEVEGLAVGDRVAVDLIQGRACGKCKYCLGGQYFHCLNRDAWLGGGYAEYLGCKAQGCHRLPDALSWSEGALVEPLAVSVHGLRKGRLRGGERVLVLGCGTIGLTAVAAARALGASTILATARHAQQGEMALALGANAVYRPDDEALEQAVLEATEGQGADIVIETVGGYTCDTVAQAVQLCRPLGQVIVLGVFHRPVELSFLRLLAREVDLIFAVCYTVIDERHDFDVAIDILAARRLPLRDMVTHTYPLAQAKEALETAYDKSTGCIKVQLMP
jgi:2-desacetyl-2-hydroxyethyl bacteriochlorophyllide A dehydrogenase